jgi:hypothetical protein
MNRFLCLTFALSLVGSQLPGTHLDASGQDAAVGQHNVPAELKLPAVSWVRITDQAAFSPRDTAEDLVYKGKMWIPKPNDPAEKGYKTITTRDDVWCSPDGKDWTRVVEHAPWAPRMWTIGKVYAGCMWLIGGYDNVNHKNLGDVWYTADGRTWQQFECERQWKARHEPTCYVYEGSLWVVAGNTWPVVNDVWKLTLPEPATSQSR